MEALDLEGQGLASVPDEVAGLTALRRLDLGRNRLTALPDVLASLVGLDRLSLRENAFTTTRTWSGDCPRCGRCRSTATRSARCPRSSAS